MNYQEAVEYILKIPKFTKKNTLEHTKQFLSFLGNPDRRLKILHVAGTNGKGSVCAYLDAALRAEGKSTGLFTSPHLIILNERIVINGRQVTDAVFLSSFEKVLEAVKKMREQGIPHPTFFEFLFGMALTAFDGEHVEYAVLETGLGGRLDATNAVGHPIYSVITAIGMDHMEILGGTVEQIASEKAGILKPGVPAFYTEGEEGVNHIIEKRAEQLGICCRKIGKNAFENLVIEHKNIAFFCTNAYYGNTVWKLRNTGLYQAENAVLALEVLRDLFGESGRPDLWRKAFAGLVWEGRMEEVLPDIYLDGAHNISAIKRFVQSIRFTEGHGLPGQEKKGTAILFSAVQDKDYEEMIACLCRESCADFYVVTHISNRRAAEPEKLAGVFSRYTDRPVIRRDSIREAWDYVQRHQDGRRIYCLGSLYLVGMIKAIMQEDLKC